MVVTHSLSILREAAKELGGFEEQFDGRWGYEDTHFGAKAIGKGIYVIPCVESPAFRLVHPPRYEGDQSQQCAENGKIYDRLLEEIKCQ